MKTREQLRQSIFHYMMLHTKHQKLLKDEGRANYFKSVIEELKQKIKELDNEN